MEIDRKLIRRRGWASLKTTYWFMFLACLLAYLAGAAAGSSVSFGANTGSGFNLSADMNRADIDTQFRYNTIRDAISGNMEVLVGVFAAMIFFALLLSIAFAICVTGPAEVSFAKTKRDAAVNGVKDWGNFLYGFKCGYGRVVKTMFVKRLYLFLWQLVPTVGASALAAYGISEYVSAGTLSNELISSLALGFFAAAIFYIPSIVKSYSYMMVPYIIAENPAMPAREAIKRSREIMRGFKWQTFVLQLSFIGWFLLGSLVCGVGTLFVLPYYYATEALLYEELKNYRFASAGETSAIETALVEE